MRQRERRSERKMLQFTPLTTDANDKLKIRLLVIVSRKAHYHAYGQ